MSSCYSSPSPSSSSAVPPYDTLVSPMPYRLQDIADGTALQQQHHQHRPMQYHRIAISPWMAFNDTSTLAPQKTNNSSLNKNSRNGTGDSTDFRQDQNAPIEK